MTATKRVLCALAAVLCRFWHERRIAVPREKLSLVRTVNEVEIANPGGMSLGIAHARLEIVLADGRTVSTRVSKQFFFSSAEAESAARRKSPGWESIAAEWVSSSAPGRPLGPMILSFSGALGQ